jgi:hypothetical protein
MRALSRRPENAGVSYAEIVFAIALATILISFALMRQGSEAPRASSDGLARLVLAEFSAAQARAQATGRPVAVCLPTDGGSAPATQSFYILTGASQGREVQRRNAESQFPGAYLSAGYWGNATVDRPASDTTSFPVDSWLPPQHGADHCFIFRPDGTLQGNDLALVEGEYVLTICSGLQATVGTPPSGSAQTATPPQLFQLQNVSAPYVLRISPDGVFNLQQGAWAGLPLAVSTLESPSVATLQPAVAPAVGSPVLVSLTTNPEPRESGVTEVTIDEGLAILITAQDEGQSHIEVDWLAQRTSPGGSGEGSFSDSGTLLMVWDDADQVWKSGTTWIPPADGAPGDTFNITVRLTNGDSITQDVVHPVLTGIELVASEKILLTQWSGEHTEMNINGTGRKPLFNRPVYTNGNKARFSPDGGKLAWFDPSTPGGGGDLTIANSDGSNQRTISLSNAPASGASGPIAWNHLGTRVYVAVGGEDSGEIAVVNLSDDTSVSLDWPVTPSLMWDFRVKALDVSGDGRFLAMSGSVGLVNFMYLAELNPLDGSAVSWHYLAGGGFGFPPPSLPTPPPGSIPLGIASNDLTFVSAPPAGKQRIIYGTDFSGTHAFVEWDEAASSASYSGLPVRLQSPSFSPNGQKLVTLDSAISSRGVWTYEFDASSTPPTLQNKTPVDTNPTTMYAWVTWR